MKKKDPETKIDESVIAEAVRSVEGHTREKEQEKENEDDAYDRLVRLTADYDNFRKRTQKEKAELVRYGNENLLRDFLPILDNFERAVEHAKKSTDVESVRTGVELILSQLKTTLDRFGLTTQPSVGEVFDPLVHEAVNHIPSPDHPANTVMEEHQKAYFLSGRLLRPALVTVSKGLETEAPPPKPATDKGDPVAEVSDEKKE
jgi:molecular chaperone GrpE